MDNIALLSENAHPDVKLTKRELSLFQNLNKGNNSRDSLLVSVFNWSPTFASTATYNDTRCVDMAVSRLKKKVAPLGVVILSNRGVGYSILSK
jgi:DNA-binding response OmpR family regulator